MNEIKIFISCLKQYLIVFGNVSFVVKRKQEKIFRKYTLDPIGLSNCLQVKLESAHKRTNLEFLSEWIFI